jgi:hypothetical protein
MAEPEFDFHDSGDRAMDMAGTPEGDGDFETDGRPEMGITSAGGHVVPKTSPVASHHSHRIRPAVMDVFG